MIIFVVSTILAVIIGMFVRAHALAVTKHIVMGWVRLYSAIMPEEKREGRREEVLSHIHELTSDYQKEGYAPSEIAVRVLENCAKGVMDDVAYCAPFISGFLTSNFAKWRGEFKRFKEPKQAIPAFATFGFMNWAYSNASSHTVAMWFGINIITAVVIMVMLNQHRPWVRRITSAWIGIGIVTMIALMAWLTITRHLYGLPVFQALMLGMASMTPTILLADKSWRKHLFKERWQFALICWATMALVALVGSQILTGSVFLVLSIWLTAIVFVVALATLGCILVLGSSAVWFCGVKGIAGLRLMAAGIKRSM